MEELQKKHRQERKNLESRITQKKKSATKKTRKGVNDECANLERQLKEQQELELAALNGDSELDAFNTEHDPADKFEEDIPTGGDLDDSMKALHIDPEVVTSDQTKKPNRQKARLARRAAEQDAAVAQADKEASNLPDLRKKECEAMRIAYTSFGLEEKEVRSDGHCLYAAVADQLINSDIGLKPRFDIGIVEPNYDPPNHGYKVTRQAAANYISSNPDDFVPFLEEPLEDYVKNIRDTGEWGGHLELLALARAYIVHINVLQGDGKVETIECGSKTNANPLWIAYYRHNFGLGEHYNSLRRVVPLK